MKEGSMEGVGEKAPLLFFRNLMNIRLHVLTVWYLTGKESASTEEVMVAAVNHMGLRPCPDEVEQHLREKYVDWANDEYFLIGIDSRTGYDGDDLDVYCMGWDDNVRSLDGNDGARSKSHHVSSFPRREV